MTKKRISTSIAQNNILQALEKNLGVITPALQMAGVSRSTYYKMLESDTEFKQKIENLKDIALDYAETSLFKQMKNGAPASTIFYLKTKGKKRGYVDTKDLQVIQMQELPAMIEQIIMVLGEELNGMPIEVIQRISERLRSLKLWNPSENKEDDKSEELKTAPQPVEIQMLEDDEEEREDWDQ